MRVARKIMWMTCSRRPSRGEVTGDGREKAKLIHSTTCLKKNKQNFFCYIYVKLPPNLTIFSTEMAKGLKLYEVHSFLTSPNSRQCTTVLNADVPNCNITLQL